MLCEKPNLTHTHTHTHIYIYIYIMQGMCDNVSTKNVKLNVNYA